jgi:hypothetical protein
VAVTKTNNAEGGTSGTAVTTGNSGGASGDAWNTVVGTAPTFDSGSKAHGTLGYKFACVSGSQCATQWTGFNASNGVVRAYLSGVPTVLPASGTDEALLQVQDATATTIFSFSIGPDATYRIHPHSGTRLTSTSTAQLGDRYKITFTVGTTTSNGVLDLWIYRGDSASPVEHLFTTTADLGTANWDRFKIGKSSTSTWAATFSLDDIAATSGSTTPAFTDPVGSPPVANAGPDQSGVAAGAIFTLDGSGSSATNGLIASYAWTQTAGDPVTLSDPTAEGPTATAPSTSSPQTLTFQLVVTDALGSVSTPETVNIDVLAATPSTNLKLRVGGAWVPAVEKVRIGGVWLPVIEQIVSGASSDASVFTDTYVDTY